MSDLSKEVKAQIIALHQHTVKTTRQIAEDLGLSKSTVARIIKQYDDTGSYESHRDNCHRPRKTNERDDRVLIRLSKENPKASSSTLAEDLDAFHGIHIDASTVRRRLLENDRPAYRPIKCQILTPDMKKRRYEWAMAHREMNWENVMFSDETAMEIQPTSSQYVRRGIDETPSGDHFQASFRHPVKVMIWSCISAQGTGRVHVVEGMMNADQYMKVLKSRVVPQMREWFKNEPCWFQQDLAPCHTAKICKNYLASEKVNVLEWPGNSPDLSPIENIWAILKKRVNKTACSTKIELINAILDCWARSDDLLEICRNLIASMPERVEACMKAKGGPICY
jgi:transposase